MNRLLAVHTPAAMVGDLLVISVELWDVAVYVHLARLDDEEMKRAWDSYADAAEAAARERREQPEPPNSSIGLGVRLADDVGTSYQQRSGHSGFPAPVWRAEWQFEPAVPAEAKRLTISNGDDTLELAL
jgi:hypothetical protein